MRFVVCWNGIFLEYACDMTIESIKLKLLVWDALVIETLVIEGFVSFDIVYYKVFLFVICDFNENSFIFLVFIRKTLHCFQPFNNVDLFTFYLFFNYWIIILT